MGEPWEYSPFIVEYLAKALGHNEILKHWKPVSRLQPSIKDLLEEMKFYVQPIHVLSTKPLLFPNYCIERLKGAKVGSRILFPYGYRTSWGTGHAMMLEVKKLDVDSFRFRIYNTGEGSNNYHLNNANDKTFLPFVSSVPVNLEEIKLMEVFNSFLFLFNSDPQFAQLTYRDCYALIFSRLSYDKEEDLKYDSSHYIAGQLSNTCSVSSLKVFFRSHLPEPIYKLLINEATLILLDECTKDMENVPFVLRKLWSRILQSLAADAVESANKGNSIQQIIQVHRRINSSGSNPVFTAFTAGSAITIESALALDGSNFRSPLNKPVTDLDSLRSVFKSFDSVLEFGFSADCDWPSLGHLLFSPIIHADISALSKWNFTDLLTGLYEIKSISLKWMEICRKYKAFKTVQQHLIFSVGNSSILRLAHSLASKLDEMDQKLLSKSELRVGSYKVLLSLDDTLIVQGSFLNFQEKCLDERNLFIRFINLRELDSNPGIFIYNPYENGLYLKSWLKEIENDTPNSYFSSEERQKLSHLLKVKAHELMNSQYSDKFLKPRIDEVKMAILAGSGNFKEALLSRILPDSFYMLRDIWTILSIWNTAPELITKDLDNVLKSGAISFDPYVDFKYCYELVSSNSFSFHVASLCNAHHITPACKRLFSSHLKNQKAIIKRHLKSLELPEKLNLGNYNNFRHYAFVSFFGTYSPLIFLKNMSSNFFYIIFSDPVKLNDYLNHRPDNIQSLFQVLQNELFKITKSNDAIAAISFSSLESLKYSEFEVFCNSIFNILLFLHHIKENKIGNQNMYTIHIEELSVLVSSMIYDVEKSLTESISNGLHYLYTAKLVILSVQENKDLSLILYCQLMRNRYKKEKWRFAQPIDFLADVYFFSNQFAIFDHLSSSTGKKNLCGMLKCSSEITYSISRICCDGNEFSFLPPVDNQVGHIDISAYGIPELTLYLKSFFAEKSFSSNSLYLTTSAMKYSPLNYDYSENSLYFTDSSNQWLILKDSQLSLMPEQTQFLASFYCPSKDIYRIIFPLFILEGSDNSLFLLNKDLTRSSLKLSHNQKFKFSAIFLKPGLDICYYLFDDINGKTMVLLVLKEKTILSSYEDEQFYPLLASDCRNIAGIFYGNRYFDEFKKLLSNDKFDSRFIHRDTVDTLALFEFATIKNIVSELEAGTFTSSFIPSTTPSRELSKELQVTSSSIYDFDKFSMAQIALIQRTKSISVEGSAQLGNFLNFRPFNKRLISFRIDSTCTIDPRLLNLRMDENQFINCFVFFMNQILSSDNPRLWEAKLRSLDGFFFVAFEMQNFLIQFAHAKQKDAEKLQEIYEAFLSSYEKSIQCGNLELFDEIFEPASPTHEGRPRYTITNYTDREIYDNWKNIENYEIVGEQLCTVSMENFDFLNLQNPINLKKIILEFSKPSMEEEELLLIAKLSNSIELDSLLPCFSRSSMKCYQNLMKFRSEPQIAQLHQMLFEYYLTLNVIQRKSHGFDDRHYWHDLSVLSVSQIHTILPLLVLFEYNANFTLLADQFMDIVTFFKETSNLFVQRIMSYGKTFVLGTFLVLLNADQKHLSVLLVPQSLYPSEAHNFPERTMKFFGINGQTLTFSRDDLHYSSTRLMWILQKLRLCIIRKEYLITTIESLQALNNKILEYVLMLKSIENEEKKSEIQFKLQLLSEIWLLIKSQSKATIDEADASLSPLTALNFPVGSLTPVNHELVDVIAELFKGMAKNEKISQKLQLTSLFSAPISKEVYEECLDDIIDIAVDVLRQHDIVVEKRILQGLSNQQIADKLSFPPAQLDLVLSFNSVVHKHLLESFTKNVNEHYGFSSMENIDANIARPYFSANTPNENSEFQQILVVIVKTLRTYLQSYLKPWFIAKIISGIQNKIISEAEFNQIPKIETAAYKEAFHVFHTNVLTLDMNHEETVLEMQKSIHLSNNPLTLGYLLTAAKEELYKLKQSSLQISCNAQNILSGLGLYVGYSGSIDNPEIVNNNAQVLIDNQVYEAIRNKLNLMDMLFFDWPSPSDSLGIEQILQNSKNIHALIDAGAIFKNLKNSEVAQKLLETGALKNIIKAVLFFDEKSNYLHYSLRDGKTGVLKTTNMSLILRTLNCLDHEIFIFLDQRHCTGVDLALPSYSTGLITLNEKLTERELFQASLRMRLFVKGDQKLILMSPNSLQSHFNGGVSSVLQLCAENSASKKIKESLEAYRHQASALLQERILMKALETRNFDSLLVVEDLFYQKLPLTEVEKLEKTELKIQDLYKFVTSDDDLKMKLDVLQEKTFSLSKLMHFDEFQGDLLQEQTREVEMEVETTNHSISVDSFVSPQLPWPKTLKKLADQLKYDQDSLLHSANLSLQHLPGFREFKSIFDENVFLSANLLFRIKNSLRIQTTFSAFPPGLFFMIFYCKNKKFIVFLDCFDLMQVQESWTDYGVFDLNGHLVLGNKVASDEECNLIAMQMILLQSMRNNISGFKHVFQKWNENRPDRKMLSCVVLSDTNSHSPLIREYFDDLPRFEFDMLRTFYLYRRGLYLDAQKFLSKYSLNDAPTEKREYLAKSFAEIKKYMSDLGLNIDNNKSD